MRVPAVGNVYRMRVLNYLGVLVRVAGVVRDRYVRCNSVRMRRVVGYRRSAVSAYRLCLRAARFFCGVEVGVA